MSDYRHVSRNQSVSLEQLLEKLLGFFPTYFDDLLRLIAGPKRFIAERLSTNRLELRDALVFLGVLPVGRCINSAIRQGRFPVWAKRYSL
jgi:hypothetical protein